MAGTPTSASGSATPDSSSRFQSQSHTVEDRLKDSTYGLVHLSDFRKRRAEALDAGPESNVVVPAGRDAVAKSAFKKRKKTGVKTGGLSFGDDDEDGPPTRQAAATRSASDAPVNDAAGKDVIEGEVGSDARSTPKRSLKPNAAISFQPKAMTKATLLREAQLKDALRKEFAQIQEAVKGTEMVIPFVFYDGKNVPGGTCRVKKGDFIWLFLDRARKLGAGLAGGGDRKRIDWARIGVDDLMLVKGDIIIPHHYDFYYFIVNRSIGYHGQLFNYSAEPTASTPQHLLPANLVTADSATSGPGQSATGLQTAAQRKEQQQNGPTDSDLEGFGEDPGLTKVVDRRWYERHKHIFPANTWEDYDPTRDYSNGVRKDAKGNAMFFSR